MVERLIFAVTGEKDLKKAWSTLVKPGDRVGIKVATAGGRQFSTHPGIVEAVVSGLELAGVPRARIVIWDRSSERLREAGFLPRKGGPQVRGIDPPRGLDAEAKVNSPVLGRLMWGDLNFMGRETGLRQAAPDRPQLSGESHVARLVSRDLTKIINLPTFSDERGCGVAGALYNVTVPCIDNFRRFTQRPGSSSIVDLYADERMGAKVALTIVDGLVAQYAGGPEFNPNFSFPYGTLLASLDPVALDSIILRKLEEWRVPAKLPPIGKAAEWLQEAETIGLGTFEPERITVQALPSP